MSTTSLFIFFLSFFLCFLGSLGKVSTIEEAEIHHKKGGRGKYLFNSSWPTDHGDVSRSKYSLNAGLPSNFEESQLKLKFQPDLKSPQWIYTQDFLYMMGGGMLGTYIAKVDALNLDIIEKYQLPPALYLGGLLMHSNGNVYCVHSNVLYTFLNGNLRDPVIFQLPTRLNEGLVQTNGMLITQDGYIVIKQWALMVDDLLFYSSASPLLAPLFYTIIILSISSVWLYLRRGRNPAGASKSLTLSLLFGIPLGLLLSLAAVVSLITYITPHNARMKPWPFLRDSAFLGTGSGGGELKFIDPVTFEVIAAAVLPDRCSVARMSMVSVFNAFTHEDEDALVLLGDELALQYRWRPRTKSLHLHTAWTKRYRTHGDGSFQATGASIYDEVAYFTDNTFPVYLSGLSYRMYRYPLTVPLLDAGTPPIDVSIRDFVNNQIDYDVKNIQAKKYFLEASRNIPEVIKDGSPGEMVYIARKATHPGFMFWSVVISPLVGDVIVWDTAGRTVQSRSLDDITQAPRWEVQAWQADCLTVAADRGHVYMSDYSEGSEVANEWLGHLGVFSRYKHLKKYFVVLDAHTGNVLGNVTIAVNATIKLSMIVPGANNDVILGTSNGLVRVYI